MLAASSLDGFDASTAAGSQSCHHYEKNKLTNRYSRTCSFYTKVARTASGRTADAETSVRCNGIFKLPPPAFRSLSLVLVRDEILTRQQCSRWSGQTGLVLPSLLTPNCLPVVEGAPPYCWSVVARGTNKTFLSLVQDYHLGWWTRRRRADDFVRWESSRFAACSLQFHASSHSRACRCQGRTL